MDEKTMYQNYPPECNDECKCVLKKDVKFECCEDFKCENICGEVKCEGRILKVNVKIKKACIDKAVSIAVLLCEHDKVIAFNVIKGKNELWDLKNRCCTDTIEKTFYFVIPDENIARERCFTINVLAHYIETCIDCPCKISELY
ncbi:MAG: hypothetical protein LIR50_04660 [Bacillota bacterium]|nr:hypothetical protein [Bacillota bacterium]